MTVQAANPPFNEYTAAPGATVFAYKFKVIRTSDIKVMVDGVAKTLGVHYTLSGVGANDGGDVTFLTPMVGGEDVVARMDMTFDRQTDYQQNGDFLSPTVNNDFDRPWLAIQQLAQSIKSSIKLGFTTTTEQSIQQTAAERANTVLAFDADGNLTISTTDAANVAAAQAAAAAAAASAASIDPANLVHRDGAETITGIKTFAAAPIMPQPAVTDETLAPATVSFARGADYGVAFSVSGNALTVALKRPDGATDASANAPVYLDFRSATQGSGSRTRRAVTGALSFTIASGATLGAANATAFRGWIVAFDDAGTVRLGVINCRNGVNIYPLRQFALASSTAGAGNSAATFYTGTAVAAKAYKVLGYFSYNSLATAGTYNAVPDRAQVMDASVPLPGTIVGSTISETAGVANGATGMTAGNTIPTITQGDLYMTATMTPTDAANVLDVEVLASLSCDSGGAITIGALFRDAVTNALAANRIYGGSTEYADELPIRKRTLAGSVSSTTFRFRAGNNASTSTTFNGRNASAYFNGVSNSYMRVDEVMA